jgi:hypothetical protein
MWYSRSPGVDTAVWVAPLISRNGCSSRGGVVPTSGCHTRWPMATLQVKVRSISRMAVFLIRSSVLASTSRALAIDASSSFTFSTRNAAEWVSGAVICCGSLSSVWLTAVIGAGWEFTAVPAGLRRTHRVWRCAGDHSGTA